MTTPQLGLQKHPFEEIMKDAYNEVYRAYLMQAVRVSPERTIEEQVDLDSSED